MIFSFLNKRIAPFALKHGLTLSNYLHKNKNLKNLIGFQNIDKICLLSISKNIISIEIHDETQKNKRKNKKEMLLDKAHDMLFPNDEKYNKKNYGTRYELLQNYLINKKILLPNGIYEDVQRYNNNKSFLLWLRHEYILAYFDDNTVDITDDGFATATTKKSKKNKYQIQKLKIIQSLLPYLQFNSDVNIFSEYKKKQQQQHGEYYFPDERTFAPTTSKINKLFQLSSSSSSKIITTTKNKKYNTNNDLQSQQNSKLESIIPKSCTLEQILKLSKITNISQSFNTNDSSSTLSWLNIFCEEMKINEIYTKEYIIKLSDYLLQRCSSFPKNTNDGSKNIIVEVGNGSNHYLSLVLSYIYSSNNDNNQSLNPFDKSSRNNNKHNNPISHIININDNEWKKGKDNMQLLIESKCNEQLKNTSIKGQKLNVIIICSWMPFGIDYTKYFRNGSLRENNIHIMEYILIGPTYPRLFSCGDDYHTWGVSDKKEKDDTIIAPFEKDGYEKINLEFLSDLQYCKFDTTTATAGFMRDSNTISFRKMELL